MPAINGSLRAFLRTPPAVAFAIAALCSACGSHEATPLGSPGYTPPDPGGAAGKAGAAGNGGAAGGASVTGGNGGLGGLP